MLFFKKVGFYFGEAMQIFEIRVTNVHPYYDCVVGFGRWRLLAVSVLVTLTFSKDLVTLVVEETREIRWNLDRL